MASNPDPHKSYTHKFIDKKLEAELLNAVHLAKISLVKRIFPDHTFPFLITEALKNISFFDAATVKEPVKSPPHAHYLSGSKKWLLVPALGVTGANNGEREKQLATWLNVITKSVMDTLGEQERPSVRRLWTANYCTLGLEPEFDTDMKRKPDLFGYQEPLLEFGEKRPYWMKVGPLGELKTGDLKPHEVLVDLANKAFCTFRAQDDRRYVVAISFHKFDVALYLFDRSGACHTSYLNMHKEPENFLRILLGMTMADDVYLGYDPTMTLTDDDSRWISINQLDYEITWRVFRSAMIRGRATTCWIVERLGVFYAVKDTWAHVGRIKTEADFLTRAIEAGVKGILTLISSTIVRIFGKDDTTENIRGNVPGLENRIHRRLVFKECGMPLTSFKSKKELISALIDAVNSKLAIRASSVPDSY